MQKFTNYPLFITNYLLLVLIHFQVIHVTSLKQKQNLHPLL